LAACAIRGNVVRWSFHSAPGYHAADSVSRNF
jgi:hypothetical protein